MDLTINAAKNIRHELDPVLVREQIEKRIAFLEGLRRSTKESEQAKLDRYKEDKAQGRTGRWPRPPEGPGYVDPMIDEMVKHERERYAFVRVIELPKKGKRFRLVYGDADDAQVTQGTGPFGSFDEASRWFLNGGR